MRNFSWKRVIPNGKGDRIAVLLAIAEMIAAPMFECIVIFPRLFGAFTLSFWIHFALGFYLWFNAIGNMIMSMGMDVSAGSTILPSVLKPGWKYCPICMLNSPPRSHHCGDCNTCVLLRDHHCIFTGRCVGHNNIRYYLTMVFFLIGCTMYCNYLNFDYALEIMGKLNWTGMIFMFVPVLGWLFGFHSTMSFFSSIQCCVCFFSSLQFVVLLYFHLRLLARGQTTFEWRHSEPRKYSQGWKRNFMGAFGSRWYLLWISPFISSPLPSDGVLFPESNGVNIVKDM